ncbi:uncharacterized protein LOC110939574 isoform X3 [Helianthus annuus]|uniref:uncharacterized protein LOC110939574 isoform X3 n=1 Tax=Helianthus annuus TaxID=4232 RepID=UPI001652FA13|nr:uncharacterized protein LOC110939574 isoform X3 [Helianthus annuus]
MHLSLTSTLLRDNVRQRYNHHQIQGFRQAIRAPPEGHQATALNTTPLSNLPPSTQPQPSRRLSLGDYVSSRDIFCMLCDNQHPTTTREKASTCVTQLLSLSAYRSTHWQPPECNELRCHMKPTLVESTDATKKLIVKVGSQLFNRLWVLLFGHIRTYFTRE